VPAHAFFLHADLLNVLVQFQLVSELGDFALSVEVILAEVDLVDLVENASELGHESDAKVFKVALSEVQLESAFDLRPLLLMGTCDCPCSSSPLVFRLAGVARGSRGGRGTLGLGLIRAVACSV
jgi:hypothetical protein